MICVYIYYTAGALLANSFFDRSTSLTAGGMLWGEKFSGREISRGNTSEGENVLHSLTTAHCACLLICVSYLLTYLLTIVPDSHASSCRTCVHVFMQCTATFMRNHVAVFSISAYVQRTFPSNGNICPRKGLIYGSSYNIS